MAERKSINLLPLIFQTDANRKFLSATVDQLISEPNLRDVNGYIGRKFAPTYKNLDSYVIEPTKDRQNYQLEPSVVIRNDLGDVTFFATYTDLLDKIKYYGGLTNDHNRLFEQEYYSFDPHISFDKFVNFSQYYWLPNGPDPVDVNTTGIELTKTFNVVRGSTGYLFISNGTTYTNLTLARGGTYTFVLDQENYPFWIQSELGLDGRLNAVPTISTRSVLGVTNNGADTGNIVFEVPQADAQDRYSAQLNVFNVEFAAPFYKLPYNKFHNQLLSTFLTSFPEYAGITGTLNGKYVVFVDVALADNAGDEAWTASTILDRDGNPVTGYDEGDIVAESLRYGVWKIVFLDIGEEDDNGNADPVLRLVWQQNINFDEKVYVKYGISNANKEFYKEFDGFLYQVPLLTANQDTLYFQDGTTSGFQGKIKIVESTGWTIDVENDILGEKNYVSPNGVKFTSGLKISLGTDVTPASYANKEYYVEQVGDGIRLVDTSLLVTPESYNDELALNYPLTRVIINKNLPDTIPGGTVLTIAGTHDITVYSEVIAGKNYLTTLDQVPLNHIGATITGTGLPAGTVVNNVRPDSVFPEYITINRSSLDLNAWSRANRWFHKDIIVATAGYNNSDLAIDQDLRAQRPIIQFEVDMQLFNYGRIGKKYIDILDTTVKDAFTELEGKVLDSAFGIPLVDGLRVLFAVDNDPLVRDKIYVVNLVQYNADPITGLPQGDFYIKLTLADDGDGQQYDSVVVTQGRYKGSAWWYDGNQWFESQQKTHLQQEPLFEVLDNNDLSLSSYTRSTFAGTKIFGYSRGNGANDAILGFPLKYRTFTTQGDIEFGNYFNTDTFEYIQNQGMVTELVSKAFLQKIVNRNTLTQINTWKKVAESSKQYQLINYVIDENKNLSFTLDVVPATGQNSIPYVKVFKNNRFIREEIFDSDGNLVKQWQITNNILTLLNPVSTFAVGDQIDVLIYTSQQTKLGYYQIPLNLDLNAQNVDIDTLTLGQLRNHLLELSYNSLDLDGDVLGGSNLRDIEIKSQGGTILQHSAPLPYASLFLIDEKANFVNAVRLAQQEYVRFKNKFLELSTTLSGIDPTDPISSVDLIITNINTVKNRTFPWYYSDMIPYGTLKTVVNDPGYTVFDPLVRSYEISNFFSISELGNKAVLVYLNNVQLVVGYHYTFDTNRPAVTFTDKTTLEIDDVITIVEYSNTDGCYVPETPTKLGLYPRYIPTIFTDDTYRDSINVIRGHDGSITPAFGDYRDNFLLELERRIYNNIKLSDTKIYQDIHDVIPGKFRDNHYTLNEINQVLGKSFMNWIGNNKLNFATNSTFLTNDSFTWNYSRFVDRIDGEPLPGSWRACYQYFYDTIRPHQMPWEMLGFTVEPDWWQEYYGPAPYTGGNRLLWEDLEAGLIRFGPRAGIDRNYARPGLTTIIPVDDNGFLKSPSQILTQAIGTNHANGSWAAGQQGPTEYAWRTSSEFPFAIQLALGLTTPGKYFSLGLDTDKLSNENELTQYLTTENHHPQQTSFRFNGDNSTGTTYRGSGYINWIADYLTNQGISPASMIVPMLTNFNVNLAYKMSGFSDKRYLKVLAEQSSPASINDSILIPDENYNVYLNEKPVPIQKISYSAVIIEKTTTGYTVRGYDLNSSVFTIIPSIVNNNSYKITVLGSEGVVFKDYQKLKLTVPYGFEFISQQQVVDFLISYERYLVSQGFTFNDQDDELSETRNWRLSVKEFLFWAQQGWASGSILVLSPVSNQLSGISLNAITQGIEDSQYGSKILDQNFKLIKNNNYNVVRSPTNFKITLADPASVIGFVELNMVQFEHSLIFDNTTVFNDIIYKPELGNRQYRLKLIGQKTADWNGSLSAPGFIYNSKSIQVWTQGKDYLKGELVTFKNQNYVALQDVIGSTEFNYAYWQLLATDEIKTGLLPNFSTIAVKAQSSYDAYGYFEDSDQQNYSHGLIGFKPRQYLSDLGLNDTTQIEFYKGYIKQKGSENAVKAFTTAEFNNISSAIDYYEEWAIRLGEYGAIDSNPFVEVALDEKTYSVNPALAEFISDDLVNLGNDLDKFNRFQLYKTSGDYTGNISLLRDEHSDYDNDIPTAGYVNADDVDATIFDLADYADLNVDIDSIGSGYTIWVAKDFTQNWNVYRVTETDNFVTAVSNSLDNFITFTTQTPHNLNLTDIFFIKNFDTNFDGFYQVYKIVSVNELMVKFTGDPELLRSLTTLEGKGMFFDLHTMRFRYMEDARQYGGPPQQWRVGEKIWIDVDAETTAVQGQPFGTQPSGTWKVYEKTAPWTLKQSLPRGQSEYIDNDEFGTSAKTSADGYITVAGAPFNGNGRVHTYLKDKDANFTQGFTIQSDAEDIYEFGYSLSIGQDIESNSVLAVGAPKSNSNIGYVSIYNKTIDSQTWDRSQIVVGNLASTGDRFGSSIAFNQNGDWLYVGAPGNDLVYIYGLSRFVPVEQNTISVNNENEIFFSSNITFSINDILTQPATGATAILLETANVAVGNVKLSSLTNFVFSPNVTVGNSAVLPGNLFINSVDVGVYPTTSTSTPVRDTFDISIEGTSPFTPYVPNEPNSLLVTTSNRTFIANVDYTLSGNTLTFLAGPIEPTDLTIQQKPYYALLTTVSGNAGSQFGYALSSSFDGAQLAVGAPEDSVIGLAGAGSVWVFDRQIEAFKSTGNIDYTTKNPIGRVYKVTIDGIEVNDYRIIGSYTVRFISPPEIGKVIYIETNRFELLEKLIGVNSLEGGTSEIQAGANFGTDLTICSNNCAIYIGAPYYDNGANYNTGAVWKFHSRGRLYGTNNGYTINPVFQPGDTFRLDNFEIEVTGSMTSVAIEQAVGTGAGNILTLSGNIRANVGDFITQSISGANITVLANTAVAGSQYITVGNITPGTGLYRATYNTANVFTFGTGNISINGTSTSVRPMASLDSFINDINDANVLGVTAVNENGQLRLNSDATVAKNLLRILAGTNSAGSDGILATADMRVFAFMQIIINPYNASGEYFGNKVQLASNAYMLVIGSARGTTRKYTTIDNSETIFDDNSTRLFDSIDGSGSVYIYELYDDPRNAVEDPGRYAFAQQLDTGELSPGINFGAAVDIAGGYITVSSPSMTVTVGDNTYTKTGSVYIFENPNRTRGWNLIRYQQPKVDIDSVNRVFLYNKDTNTILTNLELIDPAKGRILGQAEQEISFKTEYDPAYYNRGDQNKFNISTDLYWGTAQVGKVWWNLNKARFLDYEQDVLAYRRANWGRLFPGSTIEICEWVESTVLPSEYVASGADGIPVYADNSAYVELIYVDNVTNIISSKYYYWVKNKTTVDPNDETRSLPIQSVSELISNPKGQGIAYAAVIDSNAIILYNVGQYLSAKNTILHIDYEYVKGSNIIHSEYELLQKNNPDNEIPRKITNKLIDSLAGLNATGDVVPDPKLSEANRYGIAIRPRQSMFVDRLAAVNEMVGHVNTLLIQYPVAKDADLTQLMAEEPIPSERSGEYDQIVETRLELDYIDTVPLATGYKVVVRHDATQDNLWVMYELTDEDLWEIVKVQTYKTSMYWSYVDWYAAKADGSRYSTADKITYVVASLVDALKLPYAPGDIIRIENTGSGLWQQVLVNDQSQFDTIGIQNGTIQLSQSLGNFADNNLGFGNQGYESNRFDQNPNIEIRSIIESLRDSIFKGNLLGEFNTLFFVLVNYLFEEQKYADWIFKTSFISVVHNIRALTQYPNYVKDNQTYYQDYINEVKPYRTKIREYTLNYTGNDSFEGDITDFDLPPYYDTSDKIFRSPNGEMAAKDEALWQTYTYNQWYQNRNLTIDSILIEDGGSGYISAPTIVIDGGGANVNATAEAVIDGDTGAVISINITDFGSGYTTTPTVFINGTNTSPARAYAVLKNNQLRTFDTTLKFDRVSYTSVVQEWAANTAYTRTVFDANGKVISGDIITHAVLENDGFVRRAYSVNANITTGNSFINSDFTLFAANAFTNANDRIMGYYQPTGAMPARDLAQLLSGIEYPGVKVQGLNFDQQPGIGGTTFANLTINSTVTWAAGNVVTQPGADAILTFDNPITATAGDWITQNYLSGANATVFSSVSESLTVTVKYNNGIDFEIPNPLNATDVINSNIQLNGSNIMLAGYTESVPSDTSASATPYTIVTDGSGAKYVVVPPLPVRPIQTESAPLPTMTITKVWSNNKVTGKIETTADFIIGTGNIKIDGVSQASKYPTDVTYISSVVSGTPFDSGSYDNFEYDEDGVAVLSDSVVDTIIRSNYTDLALGTRAEDINVDGGVYVDRYSSHAPEEMVPGIVFDTLDMKVFTSIAANTKVLGYRIFHNMLRDPSYLRIADAYSTTLAQPLSIGDLEIFVTDASVLPEPSPYDTIPGVVFINGERITYWQIDYTENKLMQIRRGTEGTAIPIIQPTGATVVDASQQQIIPDTIYGNIGYNINVWYNDGTGVATDGTGFEGSTTDAVEFLKAYEATNTVKVTVSDELVTEDAINTITTEDGIAIFEEDQQ